MSTIHLAIDLGASSGRLIAGIYSEGAFTLEEIHRFVHHPIEVPTGKGPRQMWDVLKIWDEIQQGLRAAASRFGAVNSIGIDTWGVDYGLLDADFALSGQVASYRCNRTAGAPAEFARFMDPTQHYELTGIQFQRFNTIYQLIADVDASNQATAAHLLLLPDLLNYWLTGCTRTEITNASTTGLVSPFTRSWSPEVLRALDELAVTRGHEPISRLLGPIIEPGTVVGTVREELGRGMLAGTPVVSVASHDTASAVVAIPTPDSQPFFISCGTWSLVGLELEQPHTDHAARHLNYTNELGVDKTVRFLKNVMGLWVLNESVRHWEQSGQWTLGIPELVAAASDLKIGRSVIDINDESLFEPGDIPARIQQLCRDTGQPVPESPAEVTRCIIDSLVLAYRKVLREAQGFSDSPIHQIHMVGGGIQNHQLCQLTADACGIPVVAGPVEGTAMGNLAIQAIATEKSGPQAGLLREARAIIRSCADTVTYQPCPEKGELWDHLDRLIPDALVMDQ